MKKMTLVMAVALVSASFSSFATDDMKMGKHMDMKLDMKMMDSNGDGMISKDEFMKYHVMIFDKMKKNSTGMVDVKEMEMIHHEMATKHKGKPMGKDAMKNMDGMAK